MILLQPECMAINMATEGVMVTDMGMDMVTDTGMVIIQMTNRKKRNHSSSDCLTKPDYQENE